MIDSGSDNEDDDLISNTVLVGETSKPLEPPPPRAASPAPTNAPQDGIVRRPRNRMTTASLGIQPNTFYTPEDPDALGYEGGKNKENVLPDPVPEPEVSTREATSDDAFGTSISSRPLDSLSVREIVHSRDEGANAGSVLQEAAGDDASDKQPSTESVSTTQSGADTDDTLAQDTGGFSVDPEVSSVPMLLLGMKKTSKDKFYNLKTAMQSMGVSFLEASLKTEDGTLIEPAAFELHKLVFSKQDEVRQLVEDAFKEPNGMVELVTKCWQVCRKRGEGDNATVEVCLYLRTDPFVTSGLDGDAGLCEKFESLKKSEYHEGAGLVLALEKKVGEKIAKNKEAVKLLHPLLARVLSSKIKPAPGEVVPTYSKMDDVPMNEKEENESFLFRLTESKRTQRAQSTGTKRKATHVPARASAPKLVFEPVESRNSNVNQPAVSDTNGQQPTHAAVHSAPGEPSSSMQPMEVETSGNVAADSVGSNSNGAVPERPIAQLNEVPPTAIVLHSSEDDHIDRADEAQKKRWMRAGAAISADDGVVPPVMPWAPVMMRLNMKYENLAVVKGKDGSPILMIYP
jgi:hypothetical protein